MTEIAPRAFMNRTDITGTVVTPIFCTRVGDYAFCGASGITGLTLTPPRQAASPADPAALAIGESAFAGTNLKSVTIPACVSSLGQWAFANCAVLEEVTVDGTPAVGGSEVFRRAGSDTASGTIKLRADADWVEENFGGQGNITPASPSGITALRITALSGEGAAWELTVQVTTNRSWETFDPASLQVEWLPALGAASVRLDTLASQKRSEGIVSLRVELPQSAVSGFFRVVADE
mgnify:CR=1 FL=1